MNTASILLIALLMAPAHAGAEDLGNLSANPFDFESSSNQFGKGSPFASNGINNPFSPYGSPFSNKSATNPFATDAPRLYDQQGNYRGKLERQSVRSGLDRQPVRTVWIAVFARLPQQPIWRRQPVQVRFTE